MIDPTGHYAQYHGNSLLTGKAVRHEEWLKEVRASEAYKSPLIQQAFDTPKSPNIPKSKVSLGSDSERDTTGKNYTAGLSISKFISAMVCVGESSEIVWDDEGNIGQLTTAYLGGGTPSFSGAGSFTITNAKSIDCLAGIGADLGGSVDLGVGIGVDAVIGDGYVGIQYSASAGMPFVELHVKPSVSDFIWKYNKKNHEVQINLSLINARDARGAYMFKKFVTQKIKHENIITIKLPRLN